jgi:hypothetical protein
MKKLINHGRIELTPRQQRRCSARAELNHFLLEWDKKHDLSLEDQAYIFSMELQTYLSLLVRER